MTKRCTAWHIGGRKRFIERRVCGKARQRDDASIVPYKLLEALQKFRAIPHNSKCRYGERGAVDAKPKAQIILDAAKVSAASGGNSEPKQG